jgi:hypothetical protein
MAHDYRRNAQDAAGNKGITQSSADLPGKRTLAESLFGGGGGGTTTPEHVQRKAAGPAAAGDVHKAAQRGVADGGARLPYVDRIQRLFGAHDVSNVEAHTGEAAARANAEIGAQAYATGNHVAFAGTPDLHTAAHEAAHVVQQRGGVHLKGGVGEAGDGYEQNADAVADRVVRGESAIDLLPAAPSAGETAVQRREADGAPASGRRQRNAAELLEEAIEVIETALAVATGESDGNPGSREASAGDANADAGGTATASAATTATPPASPDMVGHLQAGLGSLIALRGAADEEIRRTVVPILNHVGAPGVDSDADSTGAAAGPPVQRNTLVLGAPLLAAGPPGWVAYAVLGVATVGIMGYAGYQAYRSRARERERVEPRVMPRDTDRPLHRGRIQVQGGGLERSFPWARPTPMTKVEALAGMVGLRGMLSRTELSLLDEAFADATAFITRTLHTCPPQLIRPFQNRAVRQQNGEERVDIEIRTGTAFV